MAGGFAEKEDVGNPVGQKCADDGAVENRGGRQRQRGTDGDEHVAFHGEEPKSFRGAGKKPERAVGPDVHDGNGTADTVSFAEDFVGRLVEGQRNPCLQGLNQPEKDPSLGVDAAFEVGGIRRRLGTTGEDGLMLGEGGVGLIRAVGPEQRPAQEIPRGGMLRIERGRCLEAPDGVLQVVQIEVSAAELKDGRGDRLVHVPGRLQRLGGFEIQVLAELGATEDEMGRRGLGIQLQRLDGLGLGSGRIPREEQGVGEVEARVELGGAFRDGLAKFTGRLAGIARVVGGLAGGHRTVELRAGPVRRIAGRLRTTARDNQQEGGQEREDGGGLHGVRRDDSNERRRPSSVRLGTTAEISGRRAAMSRAYPPVATTGSFFTPSSSFRRRMISRTSPR